jgi:hypothetical protein
MAESILDPTEIGGITAGRIRESEAINASRVRGWDAIDQVLTTSQANFLNSGTAQNNEAIRFLNGTPGNFGNDVPAAGPAPAGK